MNLKVLGMILLAGCLGAGGLRAQNPLTINYQGRLVENGTLVNGSRDLEVRIYVSDVSPVMMYAETGRVAVVDGFYTFEIGNAPLPPGTYPPLGPFPQPIYDNLLDTISHASTTKSVEILVGGVALTPRQKLSSTPYAFYAERLADDAIGANQIQDQAIRPEHLSTTVIGGGLVGGNGTAMSVLTDGSTLDVNGSQLRIKPGGITTNELDLGSLDSRWVQRTGDTMSGSLSITNGNFSVGDFVNIHPGGFANMAVGPEFAFSTFHVQGPGPYGNWASQITVESEAVDGAAGNGAGISFYAHDGAPTGFSRELGSIMAHRENSIAGDTASYLRFLTRPGNEGDPAERIRIDSMGRVGIGTNAPDCTLTVNGDLRLIGGNPAQNAILVSDAAGKASWQSLSDVLLANHYEFQSPTIATNTAEIEISGVAAPVFVDIINGPGLAITRIPGTPDTSGLNQEFDLIFDYPVGGPDESALFAWRDQGPSGATALSIIVRDGSTTESYRWTLSNFYLRGVGNGASGKRRYTVRSANPANMVSDIVRQPAPWLSNSERSFPEDTGIEISGVVVGGYPLVEVDEVAKTITAWFRYAEGGDLWAWVRSIADDGTFNLGHKDISLIYKTQNENLEIGRNNFYYCFPISYQQVGGFDVNVAGLEKVVIAYESAQDANAGGGALYVPPVIEYFPAAGGLVAGQVPSDNRCIIELDGLIATANEPPQDQCVVVQGPGIVIERVTGFDGMGNPDDQSGNNREYPIVLDVPPRWASQFYAWQSDYQGELPSPPTRKSMSMIVTDGSFLGAQEQFRFNLFEIIPYQVSSTSNGYTRVTLYVDAPPDAAMHVEEGSSGSYWGNNAVYNPSTDTEVEISSVTVGPFFPAVLGIDEVNRTVEIEFDYGEGQALFDWIEAVAETSTGTTGKQAMVLDPNGTPTNFYGCFPLSWQFHTGFERNTKCKQRMLISYDTKSP